MVLPELTTLFCNFSWWEVWNSLSTSVAFEQSVGGIILRERECAVFCVCIDKGVLEFNSSSNVRMARLNNTLQKWVVWKLNAISWVKGFKFWHKFLKISFPCNISINRGSWREIETSSTWVFKSLMKSIHIILLAKGYACDSCFSSSHLSCQDFSWIFLIEPEDDLISWGVSALDKAKSKCTRVSVEFLEVPVEFLRIKSDSVEHVVRCNSNLIHTSACVSWELRVHFTTKI